MYALQLRILQIHGYDTKHFGLQFHSYLSCLSIDPTSVSLKKNCLLLSTH